jgi:hypothetical protein
MIGNYCKLKSEKYTGFRINSDNYPHLFHCPLDNEPLMACLLASKPTWETLCTPEFPEWIRAGIM